MVRGIENREIALRAEGLQKTLGKRLILDGVSFELYRGETVAVIGRSGAGKSTLLNIVAAFDRPEHGTVCYAGHEIDDNVILYPRRRRGADRIRQRLGFVFQTPHMLGNLTVRENIELPLKLLGVKRARRRARCQELAGALEIEGPLLERRPKTLSGGERQRVAIARALSHDPILVLADEPTGNLDLERAQGVERVLSKGLKKTGAAMLLVTHDLLLAQRMANRILVLTGGTLKPSDASQEQLERHQNEAAASQGALATALGLSGMCSTR